MSDQRPSELRRFSQLMEKDRINLIQVYSRGIRADVEELRQSRRPSVSPMFVDFKEQKDREETVLEREIRKIKEDRETDEALF